MEQAAPNNINPTIADIKKKLGLDKYTVIHKPIPIKKNGKYLYQVAGFTYPLRWETIERLNIPNQRIICEVDREQWHKEMNEARQNELQKDKDPWDE